ncbi:MAG: PTS sugar transporter subunit IIA, partial [bacterium]
LSPKRVKFDLKAKDKIEILQELVKLLKLPSPASETLVSTLLARENLGSTAVGGGIAIPHCRSVVVSKVLVAVGKTEKPIDYDAPDGKKVSLFFLIVAPPIGSPGDYLLVLGAVAHIAKQLAKDRRLRNISSSEELLSLIKEVEE